MGDDWSVAKTKRTQEDRWQPVFYETARGERPAWDFLTGKKTPIDVRIELPADRHAAVLRLIRGRGEIIANPEKIRIGAISPA